MARIRNGFEGGTDGVTITTLNSDDGNSGDPLTNITGSPVYDDDSPAPLVGAMSSFWSVASGATAGTRIEWPAAKTTNYVRLYIYKTGNPTATATIGRLFDGATGGCDIRITATGTLVFRTSGGTIMHTTTALANNTLHRIELRVVHNATTGRMMLRVFSGANAHGLIPDQEFGDTTTDRATGAQADQFRFGITTDPSTGGWSIYIDEVELDDTDWVGPADRPLAIANLAGTAGDAQVSLTHSAASSLEAPITDYVFQHASTFPASAFGTSTNESGTNLGAANAQPLPASAGSGDLIIAIIGHDSPGATPVSLSAGWTAIAPVTQGGNLIKSVIAARVLDGTTGDNILSVSGAAQDYAVALLRFPSGQHGCTNANLINDLAVGHSQGASGNADPPSVDAGYSADRVWVTAAIIDSNSSSVSAVPTNYTSRENITSAVSTSSVVVCAATRDLSATQTEDPDAFTNSSRNWIAYTIAVPPAGWTTFSDGTSTSTGTTVTGLSNGTAYRFRVAGVSMLGQGAWSNVAGPYTPAGSGSPNTGAASGAVTWAGSASGARSSSGTASGAVAWAGTATGARDAAGTSTGSVTWGGAAAGSRASSGSTAGAVSWPGTATGTRPSTGDAAGSVTWPGTATGQAPIIGPNSGAAAGSVTWGGTATGARRAAGAATGSIGWPGAATGSRSATGAATGATGWSSAATGLAVHYGTATGAVTWAGDATGIGLIIRLILTGRRDLIDLTPPRTLVDLSPARDLIDRTPSRTILEV